MRNISIILMLCFCSCATKPEFRDNLPKQDRTSKLRIRFENSDNNKAKFQLVLCKKLHNSDLEMQKECEFEKNIILKQRDELIYDLPAGEYFALLKITDASFIIPIVAMDSTGTEVRFGYKAHGAFSMDTFSRIPEVVETHHCLSQSAWIHQSYRCPKLVLKENIQSTFIFNIEPSYQLDGGGTAGIWFGSVLLSLQISFPVPLPLFMGSFAFRRNIKNNLK